jgi:hypothetical protein
MSICSEATLDQKWRAWAQSRRYVLARGKATEAGKIEADFNANSFLGPFDQIIVPPRSQALQGLD